LQAVVAVRQDLRVEAVVLADTEPMSLVLLLVVVLALNQHLIPLWELTLL
jgi:hypothetical protein